MTTVIRIFSNFLSSLLRRDGLATIGKVSRYAFSPKAWQGLLSGLRQNRIVKESGLVDETWYRREYPDVEEKGVDPVLDYLTPPHPMTRLPNPDFVPGEYTAVNLDVKAGNAIPAVHYAQHGLRENRFVSTLEEFDKAPFPPDAVELRREFPATPAYHRRTAVFASFSSDGRIGEPVLYYLRELLKVVDNIVFVSNNPILPEEVGKLDGLVRLAVFRHHGCYDFGSYKIGWKEAKALGLLEPEVCNELVVCNDSCTGPVFPFSETFDEMARRNRRAKPQARFDFWGMSVVNQYGRRMIPSYFYVFGPAVLEGGELDIWFENLEPCRSRGQVILRCESMLTEYLEGFGYAGDGLVPESFQKRRQATPIKFPLTAMRDYRDPLIKIKALKGDSLEDLDDVYSFIRQSNPELSAILPRFPRNGSRSRMDVPRTARENHGESLRKTESLLCGVAAAGETVNALILSLSGDESWVRPTVAALHDSPRFSVVAAAIPDNRFPTKSACLAGLRAARARLVATLPEVRTIALHTDTDGEWPDILSSPGIVFYPSASDWSDFHYNPHYAIGRSILPVLLFNRNATLSHPLEKEFARQNYAYFWKVFFSDREAFDIYVKHSLRKGENAVLAENGDAMGVTSICLANAEDGALPQRTTHMN